MAKPASRKSGRSGGRSIFTGVLIGLIIGAILAVGVALWATGVNPFKLGKHANAPTKPVAPASPTPDTAPSFDFYKVLPDNTSSAAFTQAPFSRVELNHQVVRCSLAVSSPTPLALIPACRHRAMARGRWKDWVTTMASSTSRIRLARTQESYVSRPA